MAQLDSSPALPGESILLGAKDVATGNCFGFDWYDRTFGIGAIKVEWAAGKTGITSIEVVAKPFVGHPSFHQRYSATKTSRWFKLLVGEYLLRVDVVLSERCERLCGIRFETNFRCSQFFGSDNGFRSCLEAASGSYIHMLHGANGHGVCTAIGALYLSLELRECEPSGCVSVTDSSPIGPARADRTSPEYFRFNVGNIRAIVITVDDDAVRRVRPLGAVEYYRHLGHRETPLDDGECVLVLVEDELITGLRAWVRDGRIASMQLVTTRQTTEWFGPVPTSDACIESRMSSDVGEATHIGGFFGMQTSAFIRTIAVTYCKHLDETAE